MKRGRKKQSVVKRNPKPQASGMYDASRPDGARLRTYTAFSQTYNNDHDLNVSQWDLLLLRSKSRELYSNTPVIRSAIGEIANMSVGDGWLVKSNSNNELYKKTVEDYVNKVWIINNKWHVTLRLIIKHILRDGDTLVVLGTDYQGKRPRIQLIPAHLVANGTYGETVTDGILKGYRIHKGVIFDGYSNVVGWNIFSNGQNFQVTANNALMIYEKDFLDSLRGEPALASAISRWQSVNTINAFEEQGIKLAASKALIVNAPKAIAESLSEENDDTPLTTIVSEPTQSGKEVNINTKELRGGEVLIFDNSQGSGELSQISTDRPSQNVQAFLTETIRQCMWALSWPIEFSYNLEMGGATAKTIINKVQHRINEIQQVILLPVWSRVMKFVIAKATKEGFLPQSEDIFNFEPTYPANFAFEHLKDVKSDVELLKWGIISPQSICEKYGFVGYEGMIGKAEWLAMAKYLSEKYGIREADIVQMWPNPQTNPPEQPEADNDIEDNKDKEEDEDEPKQP